MPIPCVPAILFPLSPCVNACSSMSQATLTAEWPFGRFMRESVHPAALRQLSLTHLLTESSRLSVAPAYAYRSRSKYGHRFRNPSSQPFTDPITSPFTMYFCKKGYSNTIGPIVMAAVAICRDSEGANAPFPATPAV